MPDARLPHVRDDGDVDLAPDAPLSARLDAIRARYPDSAPEMVADTVRGVLATMTGDICAAETRLLSEVEELGRTIAGVKAELAQLRMHDIAGRDIPSATDELDAVVDHTAAATNAILESCETLDGLAAKMRGPRAVALQSATTRIFEACSFQDITGQRITKVVNTLKAIETRVTHIVATFGRDAAAGVAAAAPEPGAPAVDLALLNGPQLPMSAMDQSDIDRLLASFD